MNNRPFVFKNNRTMQINYREQCRRFGWGRNGIFPIFPLLPLHEHLQKKTRGGLETPLETMSTPYLPYTLFFIRIVFFRLSLSILNFSSKISLKYS